MILTKKELFLKEYDVLLKTELKREAEALVTPEIVTEILPVAPVKKNRPWFSWLRRGSKRKQKRNTKRQNRFEVTMSYHGFSLISDLR